MSDKKERKDRIFTVIITIIVVLLIGYNVFSYYGARIVLPGSKIREITGTDPVSGKPLNIDVGSGIVLLNLWATWCDACVREIPEMNRISSSYKTVGVIREPFQKSDFEKISPVFSNIIPEDSFFEKNRISVLPTTILLKDGIIKKVTTGITSKKVIDGWVSSLNE